MVILHEWMVILHNWMLNLTSVLSSNWAQHFGITWWAKNWVNQLNKWSISTKFVKLIQIILQSNLAIRNFLVALKLFLNAKSSLFLWSKWQIGHRKWFLNTNLFLIKQFLIAKFDCSIFCFISFKNCMGDEKQKDK